MTRIQTLASRPKRTLGALAVVLAAVGLTVGSGANFTSQKSNAGNAFTTGTLLTSISNSAAMFTGVNIVPGYDASGQVDIANTGNVTGTFKLDSLVSGNSALAGAMDMTIIDCGAFVGTTAPSCTGPGATQLSTGPMNTATYSLGNWAPGVKHRFDFRAQLPQTVTDSNLEGRTVGADYTWTSTS